MVLIYLRTAAVTKFLSKKGPIQGAGSLVYEHAYHYFEQQRIMKGEPKSSCRVSSEKKHPQGYALENPRTHVWVQF